MPWWAWLLSGWFLAIVQMAVSVVLWAWVKNRGTTTNDEGTA